MKKTLVLATLIFFVSGLFSSIFAIDAVKTSIGYGARPMGMGAAFTAVADDANAPYWNPAGLAINPGIDLKVQGLLDNRNQRIGDNYVNLKVCLETELNSPFEWVLGVGIGSYLAYLGAKSLADQGILKKNWGRSGEKIKKEESAADIFMEEEGRGRSDVGPPPPQVSVPAPTPVPTPAPTPEPEKVVEKEIIREKVYVRDTYYGSPYMYNPWYSPQYNRPTYWEDRRQWEESPKPAQQQASPKGKAQYAFGLSWMFDKNDTLNQTSNFYTISIATAWEETVSIGSNVNIYDLKVNGQKGFGAGIDVGILFRAYERLNLGLSVNEILTTDIKLANGAAYRYQMSVNAGIAILPFEWITVAGDVHNFLEQGGEEKTFHAGVEVRPVPGIALRGGLHNQNKTAGIGMAIGEFILDYAILGGEFARTQMVGFTWGF